MTAPISRGARLSLSTIVVLGVAAIPLIAAETPTTELYKTQASGSPTANGDYAGSGGGLDSHYSIFLEVTPDVSSINLDLFDADVGAGGTGGGTSEEAGLDGRDRQFNGSWNTVVTYSLFDPSGSLMKSITCDATPTCDGQAADAAWIDFYDTVTPDDYVGSDNSTYAASGGTVAWNGNWTEVNGDGNAGTGTTQIVGGQIRFTSAGVAGSNPTADDIIYRDVNLASFATTNATLQLDYSTGLFNGSTIAVDICQTGNTNCVTVATITSPTAQTVIVPFTSGTVPFTASNRLRFRVVTLNSINFFGFLINRYFQFDNVRITGDNGGAPVAPSTGHWELRIDMSSGVTGGDDLNAFGVRVPGVNAYSDAMFAFGTTDGNNDTSTQYPWITSGCKCKANDFDADLAGSLTLTAADGTSFSGPFTFSANDAWNTNEIGFTSGSAPAGGWTDADESDGYGIWTMDAVSPSSGTSVSNYTAYYLGSETSTSAGTTAPTALSPAGSFRLYLPVDGGTGGPVKPYLEQFLTYVTSSTGANPPLPGETSRYEVTVRLTNPTTNDITSATATATVPAGATFVGITAFEGNGASEAAGTVSWDIGTVSAGDEVLLAYRVDVSGNSLPQNATGTVTTNGTTAAYVDETGNAAQSLANITLGPLCELSVRTALATDAVVTGVELIDDRYAPAVVFETSSESRAAGFDILVRDGSEWTRVNGDPIPALFASGAGGRYVVPLPDRAGALTIVVEETTIDNRRIRHGPFTVFPRPRTATDPDTRSFGAESHPPTGSRASLRHQATAEAAVEHAGPAESAIVESRREGLHSIDAARVAMVLGVDFAAVRTMILSGDFRLTRRGVEVPWAPATDGREILFWVEEPDSMYSDSVAYRLERGRGRLTPVAPVAASPDTHGTYRHTEHAERDVFAATAIPLDAAGDYWFWKSMVAGFAGFDRTKVGFAVNAPAPRLEASIDLHLQGWADTPHHAIARVNGVDVGQVRWSGIATATLRAAIPEGTLRTGNTIEIIALRVPTPGASGFYLDSFDVSYERSFRAIAGRLEFHAQGATTIRALMSPEVHVLDVTDPRSPSFVTGALVEADPEGGWKVSFEALPDIRYAVVSAAAVTAASIRPARAGALGNPRNRADFLIVTSTPLMDAAASYADYRRSTGYETLVVDVATIYDELNHGDPDPRAIHAFLASTAAWQKPPRFVLLAGDGSYDYRNILGDPPQVPPFMVTTEFGIFASDLSYADFDGDARPDVAIGRLPVSTGVELLDYLDKLRRNETTLDAAPPLFASDDRDGDTDFAEASRRMSGGRAERTLELAPGRVADARARLFAEWNAGLGLLNWTGHGGLDRLASGGLLRSADLGILERPLPLLVALSCTINRFELPLFDSLGTTLVKAPVNGALAVWAPTGLAFHHRSVDVGAELHRALGRGRTIGDSVRTTMERRDGPASALYVLLGDPALGVDPASVPSVPGGESE